MVFPPIVDSVSFLDLFTYGSIWYITMMLWVL